MRVYITGSKGDKATVQMEGIEKLIDRIGREGNGGLRRIFEGAFDCLIEGWVTVRFEDECEHCGGVLQKGTYTDGTKYTSYHCDNPKCKNGFPPNYDLHRLMKLFPYGENETASHYCDRLRGEWVKENR